ncbi:MAG: restriction endonuclease subunit S [Olsenella sp.]
MQYKCIFHYTHVWEQRKLGDVVTSYTDPVPTPHNGYTRLGIRSHAKGTFLGYVEPGKELETAQMHRVASNNLIVNITFAWEHAVAITRPEDANALVSHRFPQYKFNDSQVPAFYKYLITDERFRHHLWLASPGGAGRNRVLKTSEMLEYELMAPQEDEQVKISMLLQQLDNLITLHQRMHDRRQPIGLSRDDNNGACHPRRAICLASKGHR